MALPRIIQQVRALFSAFTGSNPDAATPEVGVLPIGKGGTGSAGTDPSYPNTSALKVMLDMCVSTTTQPPVPYLAAGPNDAAYMNFPTVMAPICAVADPDKGVGFTSMAAVNSLHIIENYGHITTNVDPGVGSPALYEGKPCRDGLVCIVYE